MTSRKNSDILLRWLLQKTISRLGGGLVFPLSLLLIFIAILVFQPQISATRSDGKIELEYWEKWSGFEAAVAVKLVEAFNQKQDKIHVNLTLQGDRG